MFAIGSLSGIATLVLGWQQLYADYFSKTINIPMWLFIAILLLFPGVLIFYRRMQFATTSKELIKIEGKKFGVEQIYVDGKSFERCEFHGSELIFEGISAFSISSCKFTTPRIIFGKHAQLTLNVFSAMYKDAAFQEIIEQAFSDLRTGKIPVATPPSNTR